MLQRQVGEQVEEPFEEQRRVAVSVEGCDGFRGAAPLELRAAQLPPSGIVAEADGEEAPLADGVVNLAAQGSGHGGVDAAFAQITDQRRVANLPDAEDPQRGVFVRQGGREGLKGNFVCGPFAQVPDGFCHAAPFEAHDQLEKRAPFAQSEVVPEPLVVADAELGVRSSRSGERNMPWVAVSRWGCSPRRRRYSRMPMQSEVVFMAIGF